MVSEKVKALLTLCGKNQKGLADYLGISKQSLSNKFHRDSFTATDLIKIAEYCECSLSFNRTDGTTIPIDSSDVTPS